ncbi:MAG: M43 family zinc metalloprotease [Bacteroidia bacterium]|nr:M43 family zinc metalloprotease [Bacteroidia bacterium]
MTSLTKTPYFFLLLFLLNFFPIHAQNPSQLVPEERTCGIEAIRDSLLKHNPVLLLRSKQFREQALRNLANGHSHSHRMADEVITIPVVVHVVYNTPAENISFAQIQSQIDILNEDFRRLNADTSNFWSQADDPGIEFCLAQIDPNGRPTNGVTRTQTNKTVFTGADIHFSNFGGKDAWPMDQYMNLWVGDLGGALLGYVFPPGTGASTDGVVINTPFFGGSQFASPPYNLGRTTTHEVGHWLNLLHIWGPGNGSCSSDDNIADTPNSDGPHTNCETGASTCSTLDMVENYMDYSDDVCMNLFTTGQKNLMRAQFDPGGLRNPILNSQVCCIENPECPFVDNWTITPIDEFSVSIQLSPSFTFDSINLRYTKIGTQDWDTLTIYSTTSLTISGLESCTEYNFQLQNLCSTAESFFPCSQSISQTLGCCESPTINSISFVSDSALLSWMPVLGAYEYQLMVKETNSNFWDSFITTDTSFWLNGLDGCTDYEYLIKALCFFSDSTEGNYSDIMSFQTALNFDLPGCDQCEDTTYCDPTAISSNSAFIDTVSFGPISNEGSGTSPLGFANLTSSQYIFKLDSSYSLTLATNGQTPLAWRVWIDFNMDGVFDDTNERILDETFPKNRIQTPIYLDEDLPLGSTRMRVAGRLLLSTDPWDACLLAGFGEYEDYCIEFVPQCLEVSNLTARIDSLTNDIQLEWEGNENANFEVGYRLDGQTVWQSFGTDTTFAVINSDSLFGCSLYEFRLRQVCSGEEPAFVLSDSALKTPCGVGIEKFEAINMLVYPNPARKQVTIESNVQLSEFSLYDMLGDLILSRQVSDRKVSVGIEEIPEGIYLIRINTRVGEQWQRILVTK